MNVQYHYYLGTSEIIQFCFFLCIQGIPAFRDFTIRDPRYFVILFEAKFHDFEEKNPKKKIFFENFFFRKFFFGFFFCF